MIGIAWYSSCMIVFVDSDSCYVFFYKYVYMPHKYVHVCYLYLVLSFPFLSFPFLSFPFLSFPLLSSPLLSSLIIFAALFLFKFNVNLVLYIYLLHCPQLTLILFYSPSLYLHSLQQYYLQPLLLSQLSQLSHSQHVVVY